AHKTKIHPRHALAIPWNGESCTSLREIGFQTIVTRNIGTARLTGYWLKNQLSFFKPVGACWLLRIGSRNDTACKTYQSQQEQQLRHEAACSELADEPVRRYHWVNSCRGIIPKHGSMPGGTRAATLDGKRSLYRSGKLDKSFSCCDRKVTYSLAS